MRAFVRAYVRACVSVRTDRPKHQKLDEEWEPLAILEGKLLSTKQMEPSWVSLYTKFVLL